MRRLLFLLAFLLASNAHAITAASCSTSDVQTAINTATEGETVTVPAGSCTWTTGVTISGKGITVTGAGSNRIIAYDTGTLSLQSSGSLSVAIAGFSPGFSGSTFTTGLAVKVFQEANDPAYMVGTVTSYSSGTLTVSVSGDSGSVSCNATPCPRWLVATNQPCTAVTCITDDSATDALFTIAEDTTDHTNVGEIQFLPGTYNNNVFVIEYTANGQAVLTHDMWISANGNNPGPPSGNASMILDNSPWRGVNWNSSFDVYPYNVSTIGAFSVQDKTNASGNVSWTTASTWGAADTTGQSNAYAETDDFHAMNDATDTDDQARAVFRYSLYDNSGTGTHGADTSQYGQRYIDVNNNTYVFEGYNNGNTFNLQDWVFMRGGTLAFWGNTITNITSTDYGTKDSVLMTDYNLQESSTAQNQCWGAGSGHTAGEHYHTPRQVGFGYVTGTGTASYTGVSPNPVYTVSGSDDSVTYVGDSEPVYIWDNNQVPVTNVNTTDYGGTSCSNPDDSANYIEANRDYFNGSTAKPGYTAATYPNPLETGESPAATPTFSPAAGTYSSAQTVTISDSTSGATIYYTTNGTTPTTSSPVYSSPIAVSVTTTVQAIATASGYTESSVGSAVYTISESTTSVTLNESTTYPSAGQGINIGTNNPYGSQILKNLAGFNPSFQPTIVNMNINVASTGTTTTFTDSNSSDGVTANLFAGGTGYYACVGSQFTGSVQHCTGANYGKTFTITSNTAAVPNSSGPTFTITPALPANPAQYDSIFVYAPNTPTTQAQLNAGDIGWYTTTSGTGSATINTSAGVSGTIQCVELSTGSGTGTAGVLTYFDTESGNLNYNFNGSYTQSIAADILAGSGMTLTMAVQRSGGISASNAVSLSGSGYQTYSTSFTGSEPTSTTQANVSISYTLSGPANSSICLNNAQLIAGADSNASLFRNQVQADLATMNVGEVRYSYPVNGETLANMLATQATRSPASAEGFQAYDAMDLGLHDFLTAMKDFGVKQVWLNVPVTFKTADGVNLVDYLAAASGGSNSWANLRASLGQTEPWTSVFTRIVIEYCNECWNTASGNLAMGYYTVGSNSAWNYIPLAVSFDAALKGDTNWDSAVMKTAANNQTSTNGFFGGLIAAADTGNDVDILASNEYGMFTPTNCTTEDLFQSATTEAWANVFDSASASGYYQSSTVSGKQLETYEGQNSTNAGSCTQSQLTGLPEGEGYALTDALMAALANKQFDVTDWDFYQLYQLDTCISAGSGSSPDCPSGQFNIADWGIKTGAGGAYNNYRPAAYGIGMLNACANLGTGYAATPTSPPTFDYSGGNGINDESNVPLLQFAAYRSGNSRCIVAWNTDYSNSHTFAFTGTNPPSGTVTVNMLTAAATTTSNEGANGTVNVQPATTTVTNPASFTLPPFSMETISYTEGVVPGPLTITGVIIGPNVVVQ